MWVSAYESIGYLEIAVIIKTWQHSEVEKTVTNQVTVLHLLFATNFWLRGEPKIQERASQRIIVN